MFGEYGGLPAMHRLLGAWPLNTVQADAQAYVVMPDGTRRAYGAVEPAQPPAQSAPAASAVPRSPWQFGCLQGRRYRDPWRAAAAASVPVEMATQGEIQAVRRAAGYPTDKRLLGICVQFADGSSRILLERTQSPAQLPETLAHELGHHFVRDGDEGSANQFAAGFLYGAAN